MRSLPLALAALLVVSAADASDPIALFDGQSLDGWSGDATFWSVEDGAIVAESTPETPCTENTFLLFEGVDGVGPELGDFELTLRFRIGGHASANSGIQYRSGVRDDGHVFGYQADLDLAGKYRGALYDELGRGMLCPPGEHRTVPPGVSDGGPQSEDEPRPKRVAMLEQRHMFDPDGWNTYRIVADGSTLTHFINGTKTAHCEDDDPEAREMAGRLALQLHSGPPMRVAFKDIKLMPRER